MKLIPECAQCTLSSDTAEQHRSLVHLVICCRDAGTIRHIKMNSIKWRFACQRTHMLAGNIILLLDFRVVEERTGKIMMRPLRISRISQRRNDTSSGSRIHSNPGRWISTCTSKGIAAVASPVETGILRGHLITKTKKGQRREIVLDAAESAAQRGEICRRCRCHWKTVLPDDNLIAHERRRGRRRQSRQSRQSRQRPRQCTAR